MSNPQNVLGKFRSYAYHHILMVCNNSTAAAALSETSEITSFQHPRDTTRYAARSIGEDVDNKYITLIDGTTDARFYITAASWENIIAMENYKGRGGIPQSTSMSLDGELEIIEPLGASFLNRLTDACDELETDPVGLVFVLKTIFVGHNDDGSTEMLSNIRPLMFINYDITAIFDSSGAKYKMFFVGAVNGLGKLPHTQRIFNGLSLEIKQGETVQSALNKVALKADESAAQYKNKAIANFAKTLYEASTVEGTVLTARQSVDKSRRFFDANYRTVTYKIFANEYSSYIVGDNEPIRTATKNTAGPFNFGNNIGVEQIIKKIMASSKGVLNDGKVSKEGKRYIYKIVSGLNSSNEDFVVEYHVKRYEMTMQPFEAAAKGEEIVPDDGQSIEFNYIFTGKNVDIKSFDIKMEMGMAFFQIAGTTDTTPTQTTSIKGNISDMNKGEGSQSVASKGKKPRPKTPLFLGSQIREPMARNTRSPVDSSSFQALLSRHAALENLQAKMVIFGNPQLLNEMQVSPTELKNPEVEKPKVNKTINPLWLSVPTLVKVNIKMPVDTNDVNTEYEDFWYTGYYNIFGVKQIFSGGEFLQELDMMSIPVSDQTEFRPDTPKDVERDKKIWKEIQDILGVLPKTTSAPNDGDVKTVNDRNAEKAEKAKSGRTCGGRPCK